MTSSPFTPGTKSDEQLWTVQVTGCGTTFWSDWSTWVDRSTAEAERAVALADGYRVRLIAARDELELLS